jgi:hypothetical protein
MLCAALGWGWAQVPTPAPAPAMPVNGAFEAGITGWSAQTLDNTVGGKATRIPEALTWEQQDTALDPITGKKSAGALKVTLKELPPNATAHQSGAICQFGSVVKTTEHDLLVTFSAKLLEPADACLQLNRTWGGGTCEPLTLTKEWKQYQVFVQIGFDTPELVFSLVDPNTENYYPRKVVPGQFLLDNVVITTVPKVKAEPENLLKYGSFEAGPYLWNVRLYTENPRALRLAPEYLTAEKKDLPKGVANNTGAMKVTLKDLPPNAMSHMTGATAHLTKPVKAAESMLKVTFYAKLLSPEKANLQIGRISGGSNAVPVTLTHEWKVYDVLVPLVYDTPSVIFTLVSSTDTNDKLHKVIAGEFLLDQVVVTAVQKDW